MEDAGVGLPAAPSGPSAAGPAARKGRMPFLAGGGDMGAMIRALDWSATAVGRVEAWPQSLRTAVSILLTSGYPMYIAWGPELVQFYNDAYRPILGVRKHPAALGQTTPVCFAEIWDIIGPMFGRVTREGIAISYTDFLLPLDRNGYVEECYFDYSYSPIRDETGGIGGVFVTCSETTGRVLSERRLATLRELGARAGAARTPAAACRDAVAALAGNPRDVPFALVYQPNGGGAVEVASSLASFEAQTSQDAVRALTDPATWPLERLLAGEGTVVIDDLMERVGELVVPPWPEPVTAAVGLPVRCGGADARPEAILIAGVTPRRALDEDYRGFLELVAGQISTSMANAMAHQEAAQRADALAELDRAKTTFFSNISHEFRTPLTLSLSPLEDVLAEAAGAAPDAPTLREQDRERLEMVHRNSLRLLRLVNSLLDFSRIEGGRVEPALQPIDLATLTADVATLFRSVADRAGLGLRIECAPLGVSVMVDPEMWERVVLNLLSNAVKYTFRGEVGVRLVRDGDVAVLSVRDTGVGIAPAELERVFERFHRVSGVRSRTQEGTGIGLAMVRELVALHGGDVGIRSTEGEGTTVTVWVPVVSTEPAAGDLPLSASSPTPVAATLVEEALSWPLTDRGGDRRLPDRRELTASLPVGGRPAGSDVDAESILIADDNLDMLAFLARLLGRTYRVDTASDGVEALARARFSRPDLVLADVMMPGLDGFGLLQALRQSPETSTTPVVLLSARAGEEATVEGLDAGADDYLVKPFSTRELMARVRANLQLSRARRETTAAAARYEAAATSQARALEVLGAIARHLDSTADLSAFLGELTATIAGLVQAEKAVFWRLDSVREVLSVQPGGFGFPPDVLAQMRDLPCHRDGTDVADLIVHADLAMGPSNLAEDRFAPYREWLDLMGVRDGTAVAWRAGDQTLGILAAYGSRRPDGFMVEDTWVLRIAGLAAGLVWQQKQAEAAVEALRLTEAALLRAEVGRVAELERLKSDFLRLTSHELRGPLSLLRGYLEMLTDGDLGEVPSRVDAAHRILNDSVEGMSRLIDRMLETARLDDDRLVLDTAHHDLRTLVREAIDEQRGALSERHRLAVSLSDDPVPVVGDAMRLRMLVANILNNAIKYSPDGGTVTVDCGVETPGTAAVVVSDQGLGIAEEDMGRVFTRFGRIVTPENSHIAGTGLGLYLARAIARLHGGDVTLTSTVGAGSRLTLTLPLVPQVITR